MFYQGKLWNTNEKPSNSQLIPCSKLYHSPNMKQIICSHQKCYLSDFSFSCFFSDLYTIVISFFFYLNKSYKQFLICNNENYFPDSAWKENLFNLFLSPFQLASFSSTYITASLKTMIKYNGTFVGGISEVYFGGSNFCNISVQSIFAKALRKASMFL